MVIILCGLPYSGKSTCAGALANLLGNSWRVKDLDNCIEKLYLEETGVTKTYREIFGDEGREVFRMWETRALSNISDNNIILSLGGGTLETPENRDMVKVLGQVVYLKCSTDIVWNRLKDKKPKYLDPNNPYESFIKLVERRLPQYIEASHITVDVTDLAIKEVGDKVLQELRGKYKNVE